MSEPQRTLSEIRAACRHAWYSARAARHVGYDIYQKYTPDGPLLHVTALVESPERYRDWGDEVYVGVTLTWNFVRHVEAENSHA